MHTNPTPLGLLALYLLLPAVIQGAENAAGPDGKQPRIVAEAWHSPLSSRTATAVPALIDFEGRLADNAGSPLDTTLTLLFQIYDVESGGSSLWSESQSVSVSEGLFHARLGVTTPIDSLLFSGSDRWLGLTVGSDSELDPRTRLVSVPYALVAGEAVNDKDEQTLDLTGNSLSISGGNSVDLAAFAAGDDLGSHTATQTLRLNDQWVSNDGDGEGLRISDNGQVGIGTASPERKLHVEGTALITGNTKLDGMSNGVHVNYNNVDFAVQSQLDSSELAFLVEDSAGTNRFWVRGDGSTGIEGSLNVFADAQVHGDLQVEGALLDVAQEAVVGDISPGTQSDDQAASVDFADAGFLTTPWIYSHVIQAPNDRGESDTRIIVGNDGGIGSNNNIRFVTQGEQVMGIKGNGRVGIGTDSPDRTLHVNGNSQFDDDLRVDGKLLAYGPSHGINESYTGTIFAIEGTSTDNNWLMFVTNSFNNARLQLDRQGDMAIAGSFSKAGGSFKIDHPLDPANKYLYHSFVESPDMMNIYNGLVTTDEGGYATVTMPEWFQALNRDFRYQLTVIDEEDSDSFVQAKVVRKIRGNTFRIRSSAPGTEISWQVTGIRQDNWARENRIPVEEIKTGHEKGRYMHPELYGKSQEHGIMHPDRVGE